jgi:hypothetical protein
MVPPAWAIAAHAARIGQRRESSLNALDQIRSNASAMPWKSVVIPDVTPAPSLRSRLFWSGTLTFIAMGGLAALIEGAVFGGLTGRLAVGVALAGACLIAVTGPWMLTMAGALLLGGGYAMTASVFNRRFLLEMGARGLAAVGLGPAALIARRLTEREAAFTASAFFVFLLLGRLSLVWLATRIPALWMLTLALPIAAGCMALANVASPAMFYALSGAAVGVIFPSYFVVASERYGTGDRVASIILVAVYVGAVSVPALAVLAMGRLGPGSLFGLLALFCVLAAGLALAAAAARRPPVPG